MRIETPSVGWLIVLLIVNFIAVWLGAALLLIFFGEL
jgi:hypothetical protein